jgi:hypothetical protein
MKKAFFFIIIVLSIIGGVAYLATRTETPPQNYEMTSCDMSLWAHVYQGRFSSAQDRLQIINPCVTVSGTIINARREQDGDWHTIFLACVLPWDTPKSMAFEVPQNLDLQKKPREGYTSTPRNCKRRGGVRRWT